MSSTNRPSKRTALRAYVDQRRPPAIGAAEWAELSSLLAPVTEGYLRKLVREAGLPMAPLVEGVRQDSLQDLERTLLALEREYETASEAADRTRTKSIRRAVISAKDHARFALARLAPEKRAQREEMILWMTTWLENPGAFPAWVELRKKARAGPAGGIAAEA